MCALGGARLASACVSDVRDQVTKTISRSLSRAPARPERPPARDFELERVHDPELNRWFYEQIGADYAWTDRVGGRTRNGRTGRAGSRPGSLPSTVSAPATSSWSRTSAAGWSSSPISASYPATTALGIGGHVLTAAIRRGFELGPKVAVSTNTLDGPHALGNYIARGMTVVRREQVSMVPRS